MEGRGRTVQRRAKVKRHKNPLQEDPFSTKWGRWPEGPDGVSATPRTFNKQDEPKGRMGSLLPLELSTSKMSRRAGWGLCHPSNFQQAR